ncbi:MAG: FAD-dependent oxidoreductase [Nocardioidaceae bacterium]
MLRTRLGFPAPRPRRSLWLEQALADERDPIAAPPLAGTERSDVCVVGGGYAGLWTAIRVKQADPSLDVVILEADICGGGASGRNAGFALSWWVKAHALVDLCGTDDGAWLARESEAAIDEIGSFATEHGLDIGYEKQGWLWGSTSDAQYGAWADTVEFAAGLGSTAYQEISAEEFRERSGSPAYTGGVLDRSGAIVQPARLARGLRKVALDLGVRIFENSPVESLTTATRPAVATPQGRVDAAKVIFAIGSWSGRIEQLKALRRAMVIVSSDAIATEPIPDLLAHYGPRGHEGVSDSRLMVRYARTSEGRMIFGVPGQHFAYGTLIGRSYEYGARRTAYITDAFREVYPDLAAARITHAWGGPVDRTDAGVPIFGTLPESKDVVYGAGYSGNGLGPAVFAGHILTSLALERDDRWASHGLIRSPAAAFPPEPFRYVGGMLVKHSVRRFEERHDAGKRVSWPVRTLAGLAPAGLVKDSGDVGH